MGNVGSASGALRIGTTGDGDADEPEFGHVQRRDMCSTQSGCLTNFRFFFFSFHKAGVTELAGKSKIGEKLSIRYLRSYLSTQYPCLLDLGVSRTRYEAKSV